MVCYNYIKGCDTMLILKIEEVFLPVAVSEYGKLYDNIEPEYVGFRAKVIQEITIDNKIISDSKYLGNTCIIIEKSNEASANFYRNDIISISNHYLKHNLNYESQEEWLNHSKIIINNSEVPIINQYTL